MGMRLIGPVFLLGGQDFNMVYLDWPANDSNTYLINTGDPLILIDCGCGESLPGILENLREMELDPRDVSHLFLTHAHMPHAGAAEDLRRNDVQVVAGPLTCEAVRQGGRPTVAYQYHRRFKPLKAVTEMRDGEQMTIGACEITAVHLPGHSADSMGFQIVHEGRRMLFCGDAVRSPGLKQFRNRIDYDRDAYVETLTGLLADPPNVLYPGHGPFCLSKPEHWIGEELGKTLSNPS
ncbi:MAG: MBL fold metallo-hydrolase [Planctomycetota bacterium]|jgi:glyoxylase-like metal-dependent hydrolase (beta-lactamase superfamily II)